MTLVDDDPDILLGTSRILKQAGFMVDEAGAIATSAQKLAASGYDLLLLDVLLQDGSGLDILKKVKENPDSAETFVVMISGTKVSPREQADGLDFGADGYLTRPIEKRHFISYIKAIARIIKAEKQMKALLRERETLIKEVHHRVKNNMMVISSLLSLQQSKTDNEETKGALQVSQNRVQAMSQIHETLYHSDNLSAIDMEDYLTNLATTVLHSYSINKNVKLRIDAAKTMVNVKQASSIGLIINELVSNSLKYAFPDERKGEIYLKLKSREENEIEMVVSDNGVGMPEDLDLENTDSLGLKLVKMLAEDQLDGSIDIKSDNCTRFTLKFNLDPT